MDGTPVSDAKARRRKKFRVVKIVAAVVVFVPATCLALMLGAWRMKTSCIFTTKVGDAQMDIRSFAISLTAYEALGGSLPTTSQGLQALVERPASDPKPRMWSPGLSTLPKDPWNNDYYYEQPGKHNPATYDLYSAGPDKKPGTEDDIGNWE